MGIVPGVEVPVRVQWNGKEWSSSRFGRFDLPLLYYIIPHTAAFTAASLLSTTPQAPTTHATSATQLYYSSPIHGRRRAEEADEGEPHATLALVVCPLSAVVRVHIAFIIRRS